ncbi:MAG: cysteine synthase family protein, partial [Oscillospiraceae bacterium]
MPLGRNLTEYIGRTPLVRLNKYRAALGFSSQMCAKLEYFNPTGSCCDRAAFALLEDARERGILKPGDCVIEACMGNMGISLAFMGMQFGCKVLLVVPENANIYKVRQMRAYGAQVVFSDREQGIFGAIEKAKQLWSQIKNAYMPRQFENDAAVEVHRKTTGPEILGDLDNELDAFVCCVGTGATLSGAGEFIKGWVPEVKIIAVEPAESPVLSGGSPAPHSMDGIGVGFIPENFNPYIVDEVARVSTGDAMQAARTVALLEG